MQNSFDSKIAMAHAVAPRTAPSGSRLVDPREIWDDLSQSDRNAAYDVNAAIGDSAAWVERRNRDSKVFRESEPFHLNIPYAHSSDRLAIDLYPAKKAENPCLLFVHGGWWQRNSREDFACVASGLRKRGWSVAIPSYTLAPRKSLVEIVIEIARAIDWLAEYRKEYGIAGPLYICGWSAGAHLATLHLTHRKIEGGLAIAGIYDLAHFRDTDFNTALQLTQSDIRDLSPLRQTVCRKPLIIAVGTDELPALYNDSLRLFEKREAEGAPGYFLSIPGAHHFSVLEELQRSEGVLTCAAIDLHRQCETLRESAGGDRG